MKKMLLIVTMLFSSVALASVTYQPNDVDTFVSTGQCSGCDLSMKELYAPMLQMISKTGNKDFYINTNLADANVIGSTLSMPTNPINLQNSNFDNLIGSNSVFIGSQLDSSTFINAILENVDFSYANLSNVDFRGADLKGARFKSANLYKANISTQQLSEAILCNTVMPDGTLHTACP